jgi:hypothetical protein
MVMFLSSSFLNLAVCTPPLNTKFNTKPHRIPDLNPVTNPQKPKQLPPHTCTPEIAFTTVDFLCAT